MTDDEYGVDDGPATSGDRRPVRFVILVAAVMVLVVIVGTVAVRQDPPPVAAPTPSPSTPSPLPPRVVPPPRIMDETGTGQIRVGMSEADYIELQGGAGQVVVMFKDPVRGCEQLADSGLASSSGIWVWVRDGRVETVGAHYGQTLSTSFGPVMGDPMNRDDQDLAAWTWDDTAAVPVARLVDGDAVLTIADTDNDATIDYVTVGTSAGDECLPDIDPTPYTDFTYDAAAPAIDGTSLLGLSLGATIDEVRAAPGWTKTDEDETGCAFFIHDEEWGAVFVRDVVVGLEAQRVSSGPEAGETVDEATGRLGLEVTDSTPDGYVHVADPAGGRRFLLYTPPSDYVLPAWLDVPVATPISDPGKEVIAWILVGDRCNPVP